MAVLKPKVSYDPNTLDDFEKNLHRDYREDLQSHDDHIEDFDAYEAMDSGKTFDSVSKQTGNGLTDSATATIYLERAARVAGQLPEGEVQAFGKKDKGKAILMDILRKKWIYPNANAQRSFKTKMYMWQYGSSEYGYMPMYYDLNVSPSGYYGPDCWIWNPRNFIPQAGFTSIADMDYVHALAYKSPTFFENLLDDMEEDSGYDFEAIRSVRDRIKEATREMDPKRDTKSARENQNQSVRQVCVATRYEAGSDGEWVTFLPDFSMTVIRRIKNPHKNGRIPFVIKPCIPKFDSFYNVGDFQRSMPMQAANDALDNYYFQGIRINLFPPTVVDSQAIIRHTVTQEPGAIWEVTGGGAGVNAVKRLETSTAGLSSYQNAKGMARGALQSIAGVTDTRPNTENAMDPGMGRTPEALKMIQSREDTRDNQDRELLEEAMKELLDGMLSLIPTMAERIPVDMFSDEIEEIAQMYPDLIDVMMEGKLVSFSPAESMRQARLRIDPTKLKGLEYRFELQPNSTAKKTKEEQLAAFVDYISFLGKMPNALELLQQQTGQTLNIDEINKIYGSLSDIPGMDRLFTKSAPPAQPTEPGATSEPQPGAGTQAQPSGEVPLSPEAIKALADAQPAQPPVDATAPPQPPTVGPTQPAPPEVAPPVAPVSPQNPVIIGGMRFTDPVLADQAKKLMAGAA